MSTTTTTTTTIDLSDFTQPGIAILGIALFFIAIYVTVKLFQAHRRRKLFEESKRLAALRDINDHFKFYEVDDIVLEADLSSKAKYDRFDEYAYAQSVVARELDTYKEMVSKLEDSQAIESEYRRQVKAIAPSEYDNPEWVKVEKELFEDLTLKPKNDPELVVVFSYTSPAGRNHYEDETAYSFYQIKRMVKEATLLKAKRKTRSATIQRERSLMTDSLRYDVLRRDGFRCVLCGSAASDGVKLEVDHIVPVSKGGRTELSNLRTLCDRCNRGKSDKME